MLKDKKFNLIVTVDVNDGDLITNTYNVSFDELDIVIPLFKKLKKGFNSYDWEMEDDDYSQMYGKYNDVMTKEEVDILSHYIPSQYGYTRTVERVVYIPVNQLFKVL